ncbi:hypothetical protein HUA76_39025 [Myxococcus sp. CA056]|uniref:hypothetical protein n=1 Tax=Myxococcus sp. CA056 TaxID=2741740 RepID=UPI00157AF1A0|nr:hypothetical protein [Myxococcus sp. CA056]NTX16785.1 hypothetical protein [Myxococcus sp. CA056]
MELERRRVLLEEKRFEHERTTSTSRQGLLNRNLGAVISVATILISGVQVWVAVASKEKELALAKEQKERELQLAQLQAERELDNGWRKDFFEYLKLNDEAIFGADAKKRILKRNVLVAAFPESLVGQIRVALAESAGSAGELSLVSAQTDMVERPPPRVYLAEAIKSGPPASDVPAGARRLVAAAQAERTRVFVHYADPNDRSIASALSLSLDGEGYGVPSPEILTEGASSTGDVRYFHADDKQLADKVGALVQQVLGEKGVALRGNVRVIGLQGKYGNMPRRVLEVWLPALGKH